MLHYNPQRFEQCLAHLQEDKLYYYSLWYRHSGNRWTIVCPPEDEQGTARNML